MAVRERFMKFVQKQPDGCWHWTGSLTGKGYGKFWYRDRLFGAHEVSYMLFKGGIDKPLVRHLCHVRKCVNPEHLISGTYIENANDGGKPRGRQSSLTEADLAEIKRRLAAGELQRVVAKAYNMTQSGISALKCRSKL